LTLLRGDSDLFGWLVGWLVGQLGSYVVGLLSR